MYIQYQCMYVLYVLYTNAEVCVYVCMYAHKNLCSYVCLYSVYVYIHVCTVH